MSILKVKLFDLKAGTPVEKFTNGVVSEFRLDPPVIPKEKVVQFGLQLLFFAKALYDIKVMLNTKTRTINSFLIFTFSTFYNTAPIIVRKKGDCQGRKLRLVYTYVK